MERVMILLKRIFHKILAGFQIHVKQNITKSISLWYLHSTKSTIQQHWQVFHYQCNTQM